MLLSFEGLADGLVCFSGCTHVRPSTVSGLVFRHKMFGLALSGVWGFLGMFGLAPSQFGNFEGTRCLGNTSFLGLPRFF